MSAATTSGRATDQAIAKIKDLISSGEFTAGSRLPTERELTQRFGVSRSSLREAIRALALIGVLESRVGDGTYVTTLEPELLLTGMAFVSDLVAGGSLLEMHQVRRILEPEATRLATPRLTEHDLARLEECLRQMNVEKQRAALHRGGHRVPRRHPRRLRKPHARIDDPESLQRNAAGTHVAGGGRAGSRRGDPRQPLGDLQRIAGA